MSAPGVGVVDPDVRREQLRASLDAVNGRIERACADAGRDPAGVTLVVVTKFFPASDVLLLHELGVRSFGENRDQEAAEKYAQVREALDERAGGAARGSDAPVLHFIGRLQGNKAAHVAQYADVVESLDRVKLVAGLAKGAHRAGRRDGGLEVLLQVSLDGDTSRGGALPEDLEAIAAVVEGQPALRLRGLMAVAPLGADPDASFAALYDLARNMRERHPGASWLSAGMSGDLEAALRHGATHLRVGTAILGSRPSLL
ncbi:YggS family pyridoxal phosphate-dependent enzyme [Intrasporangium sp. YIM S08009]|uniref:YggS family pyridoxal phosphate-dependent enzyme n=1 Tax=Intrasporangium zincisolvens TaxID=3080018 RepID=UPI002B054733|nr:YggS family pyridoxal phosphate-dependent enzyme [Intrasporangium sp. YIM S08009]